MVEIEDWDWWVECEPTTMNWLKNDPSKEDRDYGIHQQLIAQMMGLTE